MSLGDYFPEAFKKASAARSVAPGMVIKIEAVMDDGQVHEKRFLVVHVDERTVACVINSEIHPLILKNPSVLKCQVEIEPNDHPFMEWSSHIDCSKVWKYSTEAVIDSVTERPDWVLGMINDTLRDQVVASIKFAPQIAPIDKGIYCASLDSLAL
jgi:hypothetical protein